jgi:hypothetical protein
MGVDDGAATRQSHPESAGLRRVEGIENLIDLLEINSGPEPRTATTMPLVSLRSVLIDNWPENQSWSPSARQAQIRIIRSRPHLVVPYHRDVQQHPLVVSDAYCSQTTW